MRQTNDGKILLTIKDYCKRRKDSPYKTEVMLKENIIYVLNDKDKNDYGEMIDIVNECNCSSIVDAAPQVYEDLLNMNINGVPFFDGDIQLFVDSREKNTKKQTKYKKNKNNSENRIQGFLQ